jgi:hypothetical protein
LRPARRTPPKGTTVSSSRLPSRDATLFEPASAQGRKYRRRDQNPNPTTELTRSSLAESGRVWERGLDSALEGRAQVHLSTLHQLRHLLAAGRLPGPRRPT